jgi:hypothetical protein
MAAHPSQNQRAAAWEKRLKVPVIIAATAVLPLVALGLSQPTGAWHTVETIGHWAIWLTFVIEVAIMLAVVDDRLAWISGHRLELLVVVVSSPLVPLALAVAPALRLLVLAKAFKALKLAKAVKLAKLAKSVRLLRRKLALTGATSIALGLLALVLGGLTAWYMATGRSPLKGAEKSAVLVVGGVLVTFGVNHLWTRAAQPDTKEICP